MRQTVRVLEAQLVDRFREPGPVIAVGSIPPSVRLGGERRWRAAVMVDPQRVGLGPVSTPGVLVGADPRDVVPELGDWVGLDDVVVVLQGPPVPAAGGAPQADGARIRVDGDDERCGVAGLVMTDDHDVDHVVTVGHLFDRGSNVERATGRGWRHWGRRTWMVDPAWSSPNAGWDLAIVETEDHRMLHRPAELFDPLAHEWSHGLAVRVVAAGRTVDGEVRPAGGIPIVELSGIWTIGGDPPRRWSSCWAFTTRHDQLACGDSGAFGITRDGKVLGLLVGGTVDRNDPGRRLISIWLQDLRTAITEAGLPVTLHPAGRAPGRATLRGAP